MLVTVDNNLVHVTLSRRNVRELAGSLDEPARHRRGLARKAENGLSLILTIEDDAEHYADRGESGGRCDAASAR